MGRGWKNLELNAREKSTVSEMDFKGSSGEGPEGNAESCQESFSLLREFCSVMNKMLAEIKVSDEMSTTILGSGVTDSNNAGQHRCYKVVENMTALHSCSSVRWEIKLVSDEIGYLAEKIPKQSVDVCFSFS